jgi:hypothetical protein
MRELGYSLSWVRLLTVLSLEVLDILGNPKKTLGRMVRRIMVIIRKIKVRNMTMHRQSDKIASNRDL